MAASIVIDGATTLKTLYFKNTKNTRSLKGKSVRELSIFCDEFHVETRKWNFAEEDLDSR